MDEHVLIVEDDEMVQGFLRLHLENEGYRVTAVETGGAIDGIVQSDHVDLIILDLGLPDGDGIARLHDLREHSRVPVVVATARQGADDRLMALGIGADDYVTKPYDQRELLLRVKNVLSRSKAPQQERSAAPSVAQPVPPQPAPAPPRAAPRSQPAAADRQEYRKGSGSHALLWACIGAVVVAVIGGGAYFYLEGSASGPERVAEQRDVPPRASQPVPPPVEKAEPAAIAAQPAVREPVRAPTKTETTAILKPEFDRTITASPVPTQPDPARSVPAIPAHTAPAAKDPDARSTRPIAAGSYSWVLRSKCDKLPDVEWWRFKTHLDVVRYVNRKHGGDWSAYLSDWRDRYGKLKAILDRNSGIRTSTGVVLKGETLARYVADTAIRVAVTQCLAAEASAYEQQKLKTAR